jgi:hydrogenase maturation protease
MTELAAPVATARSPVEAIGGRAPARERVLVAGVGYDSLRDMSVGPLLIEQLGRQAWPAGVELEDLSAGAVHVTHALQAREPYAAAVFVTATQRGDQPGTVRVSRYKHGTASPEEVQIRVTEAVTGVVSIDTLLTVLDHFGALPDRVVVVEVEPRDTTWGHELSPAIRAVLDDVGAAVRSAVAELVP